MLCERETEAIRGRVKEKDELNKRMKPLNVVCERGTEAIRD